MKILIWGTGQCSWTTVRNISEESVIGYVDTYCDSMEFAGKPLYKPFDIKNVEYDAILVSTIFGKEIAETCKELKIPLEKVIFVYGNIEVSDMNQNYEFVTKICGKKFADSIKNRYHIIREIDINLAAEKKEFEITEFATEKIYQADYIRLKTFELLVDEIKKQNINGQIAELGVFRGDFAQILNAAFPDRRLYLFDTFEGFDENELSRELKGNVMLAASDIYKNTSIQIVISKMRYRQNVIIKKGFFPDSLEGLEEEFAFVSLDCDWEESLYQGLVYFYPRLTRGGYIMIHDYNNHLDCAKKAMKRYEDSMNIKIAKVPICDTQGSLILTK